METESPPPFQGKDEGKDGGAREALPSSFPSFSLPFMPRFMCFGAGGEGSSGLRAVVAGRIADRIAAAPPAIREQFHAMAPAEKEAFLAARAPGLKSLLLLGGGGGEGRFPLLELVQELHPAISAISQEPKHSPPQSPSAPLLSLSPVGAFDASSTVPNLSAEFLENVFEDNV